jgi:hypothetical protein
MIIMLPIAFSLNLMQLGALTFHALRCRFTFGMNAGVQSSLLK